MADNILPEVLRIEENGIEFFTITTTGESAVSERGLAKMCGLPQKTVNRWLRDLSHAGVPKWLKSLQGTDLHLSHEIKKRGKVVKPISAPIAAKFIGLVAMNLTTTSAIASLQAFAEIGLTSFIQTKTGWLSTQYTASPSSHEAISRILDTPNPWERLYSPKMCRQAFGWFGAQFYWDFCYFFLTPNERVKLNAVNPPVNGMRDFRIHQFLDEETRERLEPEVAKLATLLEASTCKQMFLTLYANVYSSGKQLELM